MSAQPTSKNVCKDEPGESWIEREWARFQDWAAARQVLQKQQVEGHRVTDDHR